MIYIHKDDMEELRGGMSVKEWVDFKERRAKLYLEKQLNDIKLKEEARRMKTAQADFLYKLLMFLSWFSIVGCLIYQKLAG